jgi:glycosyltransferase involved in cell wall biosynthesis
MSVQEQLKVLQIFKYYHPHIGGVEKVAQDIAEGLKGDVDTRILACHENLKSSRDHVNGIEVVRAGRLATYFSVPLAPRFPFLLRRMAADRDILHFHLPFPLGDVSYLLARPRGRVVAWWHSEIVKPRYLSSLYRPLLKQFLKKVDRIIVAAPQLVDESPFLSQFKTKCRVIPIGIGIDRFRAGEESKEKAEGIRKRHGTPIVFFVGRLIYYKGLDYLIEAMGHLRNRDAILLVAGEGPLKAHLQTLAVETGVSDRVVFLGKLSDDDLTYHYHACDVFVLPSVANTEAFGIVQLEAMACGKPVISTDLPTGVPFVNVHGKTGLIVPPKNSRALADAIETLLGNTALASDYGEAGRRRVDEEFTVDIMLRRVLELYKEVMTLEPGVVG